MNANAKKYNPWLCGFAVLTAVATFLLLGAGGLVTSHEAGMSVPDWPNSYGYNMFAFPISKWTGGIFYEHTHRLWASVVGLMTTILAIWIWVRETNGKIRWTGVAAIIFIPLVLICFPSLSHFQQTWIVLAVLAILTIGFGLYKFGQDTTAMKWLGITAFAAVILQGVLGGLRVTMKMDSLGIFHGAIAQTFFVLTCAIALFTSRFWIELAANQKTFSVPRGLRSHVLFVTILIFLQLILGATMRHQHAGLAIPDFPAAYGKIWPNMSAEAIASYNAHRISVTTENTITVFQIILQMIHRIVALVIFAGVAAAVGLSRKRLGGKDSLTKLAIFWLALTVFQIVLGIATIETNKAADIATAHVLVGALALATGALWCAIAFQRSGVDKSCPDKTK